MASGHRRDRAPGGSCRSAALEGAELGRCPPGELTRDDRGSTAVDPDGLTCLDRLPGTEPRPASGCDASDEDVAPPAEQTDEEGDRKGDRRDDERCVRVFRGLKDRESRQPQAGMLMLEILQDDKDERRCGRQAEPEAYQPPSEDNRLRVKALLRRRQRTGDDPEPIQAPRSETDQAKCRRDDNGRSSCAVVSGVSERLIEACAIGEQEDKVVGDDESDRRHREESENASRACHVRDYTADPHMASWSEVARQRVRKRRGLGSNPRDEARVTRSAATDAVS
jgi:hypothetical protein